ncbi:unnamed protein product [Rotaria sordida]|uniref:EF-hand domain-containing protein n=1 Tax=Rotaria sordida TaxID=392033 RepID=A0A819RLJ5_9BILA|nr:unnamed protein product [Rotaria sordida]
MATIPNTNLQTVDDNVNTIIIDDNKKKQEDEAKKSALLSNDSDQGGKTTQNINDLNNITQVNRLSSVESSNEGMKSSIISSISNNISNMNIGKKNEGETIETIEQTEEYESLPISSTLTHDNTTIIEDRTSSNILNNDGDSHISGLATIVSESNKHLSKHSYTGFLITKDDSKSLTNFQLEKAKYFFNINLDIENKGYVTWEDVEFYLLFHITAAGKEGSDGGDLEARLSRATRAFWEHVHDQIPLADGKRNILTLDQFLDAWASLIDYVVRTNQLPSIVQDLVKLGFELYSTDDSHGQPATIQPNAFDQLFQKMNLGRPHAIIAYKFLTENDTKPLDVDKIESLVKAVITSSDEEHDSHFLLPGFFKVIGNHKNIEKDKINKLSPSNSDKEQSEISDNISTKSTSQSQQPNVSSFSETQQTPGTSSSSVQDKKQPHSISQTEEVTITSTTDPSTNQQQNINSQSIKSPKAVIQNEDENIRRLLRFYHIDDGDIVEVADGSVPRVVLLHPERPLPAYIQQNPQLLKNIQKNTTNASVLPQNGINVLPNLLHGNNTKKVPQKPTTTTETKPKVTLGERLSRGETQPGPTIPLHQQQRQQQQQQQQQGHPSTTRIHQVYPHISDIQQEEQLRQAKLQANQSNNDEKTIKEEISTTTTDTSSTKQDKKQEKKEITREDEEKIVAAVLKRLTPIVEQRVAEELRRIQTGEMDQYDDEDFMPFPLMFSTRGAPIFIPPHRGPSQGFRPPQSQQQQSSQQDTADSRQQQHQANLSREDEFVGLPPGAAFIPPPIFMAMMTDFARGGMGGEIPVFSPNMPPSAQGPGGIPTGLEGFMMFVEDEPIIGVPPGYPLRPEPRF